MVLINANQIFIGIVIMNDGYFYKSLIHYGWSIMVMQVRGGL